MTDPSDPNIVLGTVLNKPLLELGGDIKVLGIADSVTLTDGMLVYQDGSNGLKVVPTSAQPQAGLIRFLPFGYDNGSGVSGHAKYRTFLTTYKRGARVVGKAEGAIVVGAEVRASTSTAGSFATLSVPADITTPANIAAVNAISAYLRARVGVYNGHPGQGIEQGSTKQPTDAADGDRIEVTMN